VLKACAHKKNDNARLLACVSGDWQTIVAMELFYHKSCYKICTRQRVDEVPNIEADALQELFSCVEERVVKNYEVLQASELPKLYIGETDPDKRTLCDAVVKHFDGVVV
jgi:hypothetical protein